MIGIWGYILELNLNIKFYYVQMGVLLCSSLLAQYKYFVERKHKISMTNLVACLDREIRTRWDMNAKNLAFLIRR